MWKTPYPTEKYPDSKVWVCALFSGISKPRFCQTYVLQFGACPENDGNHENDGNDEDNSDSHKQGGGGGLGGWLLDLRKSRKARKWRKPRETRVQNIGSPKPRFRKIRFFVPDDWLPHERELANQCQRKGSELDSAVPHPFETPEIVKHLCQSEPLSSQWIVVLGLLKHHRSWMSCWPYASATCLLDLSAKCWDCIESCKYQMTKHETETFWQLGSLKPWKNSRSKLAEKFSLNSPDQNKKSHQIRSVEPRNQSLHPRGY